LYVQHVPEMAAHGPEAGFEPTPRFRLAEVMRD
jgi:hypothetical protein